MPLLPHVALPAAGDRGGRDRLVWTWIYADDGPLNEFLGLIGLGSLTRAWLGDFTWALPAVGLVGTWVMYGLAHGALHRRRAEDPDQPLRRGARRRRRAGARVLRVTLPGLRGEIAVALVLTTIDGAAQLRPRLHHDRRRARNVARACRRTVYITARSRRRGRAPRRRSAIDPGDRDLRARVRDHAARRAEQRRDRGACRAR